VLAFSLKPADPTLAWSIDIITIAAAGAVAIIPFLFFAIVPVLPEAADLQMHHIQFREIMRDAEIARAILPIVRKHHLTEADTEKALLKLHVPRVANIARINVALSS
jgi:hypothetical protein